jgi:hypothetical protein
MGHQKVRNKKPETRKKGISSGFSDLGRWFLFSGFRILVSSFSFLVSGF